MAARVKLCAIAKNEGPYLADWVFHHLYFGFDAVEVWVNGTTDGSLRILRSISAAYPQVGARKADRLLAECLSTGRAFQRQAYSRLARRARREGFSHVAFLDLDEYWTPRDATTGVQAFVPESPEVNVVSFQWCVDVPGPARAPFAPPLTGPLRVQLGRHVKSLARLDGSVRDFRTHTALTRSGVRLLVRDPFPMVDRAAQLAWSMVPDEHLSEHGHQLPEAFVLHAINRSELEYVASLAKGLRQTGAELPYKTNRFGYLPGPGPVLEPAPPARTLRSYHTARRRFRRRTGVEPLVRRAEALARARAEQLLDSVRRDGRLSAELGEALRGVSLLGSGLSSSSTTD